MQVTGGRNGYGAKLTNIFSTKFAPCRQSGFRLSNLESHTSKVIECADGKRGQKYLQSWENNMGVQVSAVYPWP